MIGKFRNQKIILLTFQGPHDYSFMLKNSYAIVINIGIFIIKGFILQMHLVTNLIS